MKAEALFAQITADIVEAIENGAKDWRMPWRCLASAGSPVNVDGRSYRGINAFMLPFVGEHNGYDAGVWGTYKAWQGKGAQVRKGEKATPCVLWKRYEGKPGAEDPADRKGGMFATSFAVFAAEQCDGAEETTAKRSELRPAVDTPERIAECEALFAGIGTTIVEGGNRACYMPGRDEIHVPKLEQFASASHYYSTLAHEHTHWTGAPNRLDRKLDGKFGSDAYAAEELVAELGAAFFSAQACISAAVRDDHASYLASWLRVLKETPRALVTVASKAQAAVDYLYAQADACLEVAA